MLEGSPVKALSLKAALRLMLPEAVTPRESWADERAGVALMRQRSETHIHGTGSGSGLVGDTGARCSRRWRKREVWTAWPLRMWPSVSGAYPGHLRRLRPAHRPQLRRTLSPAVPFAPELNRASRHQSKHRSREPNSCHASASSGGARVGEGARLADVLPRSWFAWLRVRSACSREA